MERAPLRMHVARPEAVAATVRVAHIGAPGESAARATTLGRSVAVSLSKVEAAFWQQNREQAAFPVLRLESGGPLPAQRQKGSSHMFPL